VTGNCVDINRYAIHDGPGIRTTVFLKGCPLTCSWCHNPEGQAAGREIMIQAGACIVCGACVEVCPAPEPAAMANAERPVPVSCLRCGECVDVCAPGARRMVGGDYSVTELMDALERDRPFYEESGGGVTFSGGEPLLQGEFLLACLEACRERGLRSAVDTCGFGDRELMLRAAALADLYLFDLKTLDAERHRRHTGVDLAPILDNLRALDAAGAEIWIRTPLIPGFNDDRESVSAVGEFVASLPRARRLHLLPYHVIGEGKGARLRRPGNGFRSAAPSSDALARAAAWLAPFGLDVHIGG
jgi:pyruvate formate lyase activating enzyme